MQVQGANVGVYLGQGTPRLHVRELRPDLKELMSILLPPAARVRRVWLPVLALLGVVGVADAGEDLDARLANGDIVVSVHEEEGFDIPPMYTRAVIDAPPEKVFALVNDCNAFKTYIPRVVQSSETSREGNHSVCKFLVDMPWPMDDLSSTVEATVSSAPGKWTREFVHKDGNFIRNDGVWTLTPFGDDGKRTRVEYKLHSAFKTMLPNAFVRSGQKGAMKDLIKSMRSRLVGHD